MNDRMSERKVISETGLFMIVILLKIVFYNPIILDKILIKTPPIRLNMTFEMREETV